MRPLHPANDSAQGSLAPTVQCMRRPLGIDRQDATLAAVVVAAGQVDVLAPDLFSTNLVGPRWAISVSYLVADGAVILRRARPGTAFAIMAAALAAQALSIGTSEGNGSLIPALVLSYSVAMYGSRRVAIAALCAIPVVATVREVLNPENISAAAVFNGLGWDLTLVAAWLLGAYLRTRRQLVAELRQRAADSAEAATAAERARVARELHDVLAHSLGVIVVQAEAAEEVLGHRPEAAAESLQAIQRTGREALVEIRRLVGILREDVAVREPAPGAAAVEALVGRVTAAGLPVALEVHGSVDGLPAAPDLAVYRIVQESLTNALKHAGASSARVLIDRRPDRIWVEVVDDGRGTPSGLALELGNGLRGMRERVTALGGSFQAGAAGDGGFAVRAVLSLEEPS
jgi:signal transduction histidine kinase